MRFLMFLFVLCTNSLFGYIQEAKTFSEICQFAQPDTLILLDIDNTLICSKQALGGDTWFYTLYEQLKKDPSAGVDARDKALMLWFQLQEILEVKPVEESTPKVIKDLQSKKIPMMALTTRGGPVVWSTLRQLQSCDIDLTITRPFHSNFIIEEMPKANFRDGILFSDNQHKGKVLLAFLKQCKISPSRILFINDKLSHLKEVEESVEKAGIAFIGLRYSFLDESVAHFRSDLADIQLKYYGKILDDEAAEILLKAQKTTSSQ
jgi:hypothetical protein